MTSIAVSGKGGTGKTTVSALLIRALVKKGLVPVLAVDADPNSNLYVLLGMKHEKTMSDIREKVETKDVPQGMTKIQYVASNMEDALVEGSGMDMLVMGLPEGEGCYCAVNHLLREYLSKLSKRYRFVVIDNEAGLEHLSRRTTDDVDLLLLVTDPTMVGLKSAFKVKETADRLALNIKSKKLLINKYDKVSPETLGIFENEAMKNGIEIAAMMPADKNIEEYSETGRSVLEIPENSPSVESIRALLKNII